MIDTRLDTRDRQLGALSDGVQRLAHLMNRARAQVVARAEYDIEWSATMLIMVLVKNGPMRSSALAQLVQADPSTVSRTVASMVTDGLVERRPDPSDGRAILLMPTDKAEHVYRHHCAVRDQHFANVLDGWSETDVATLSGLLSRFTDDFECYRGTVDDEGWLNPAASSSAGKGTH